MGNEEQPKDSNLYQTLGSLGGIMVEMKEQMRHFINENKEEHKEILAKFGVFTLEKDTNALANKIRAQDVRIDAIETRMDKVEAKPVREKAAIVDSIVRYGLAFLGSGVFLYFLTHLGDIAAWFKARP